MMVFVLVLAATTATGLLAEARLDQSIKQLPARKKIGFVAYSQYNLKGETKMTEKNEKGEEEVSPSEDLMREHGVLNRTLLIYEEALRRLTAKKIDLKPEVIHETASLLRRFIEDYHENWRRITSSLVLSRRAAWLGWCRYFASNTMQAGS